MCEYKQNDCAYNPCKNGGTCQQFGSLSYVCICPSGYSGFNCTESSNSFKTTTTSTDTTRGITPVVTSTTTTRVTTTSTPSVSIQVSTDLMPSTFTDFDPFSCRYYLSLGYCEINAYINGKTIKEFCPVSCNSVIMTSTTTTTTSTQLISNLNDFNPLACAYYSSLGLCDKPAFIYKSPIKEACGKTCNNPSQLISSTTSTSTTTTTTKIVDNCTDKYPNECAFWKNYCYLLDNSIDHPCKKTCSKC